jgi:hypothetical protein
LLATSRRFKRGVLREIVRRRTPEKHRKRASRGKRAFAFCSEFFAAQRAFHDDRSPRKAALTGRRSGKSTYAAGALIEAALSEDDAYAFYITLTRKSASFRFVWKEIRRLCRVYHLDAEFNITERVVRFRNGSEIWLCGAVTEDDVERLRGANFVLAIVDEAGSFGDHIRELVFEILEPSTIDYDGQIALIGTPTPDCTGLFFEITEGTPDPDGRPHVGWSVHRWTVLDNPHVPKYPTPEVPDAKAWLERFLSARGLTWEAPTVESRWLGKWRPNPSAMVYRDFSEARNVLAAVPKGPKGSSWFFGLGIDLGYDDPTVLALVQWNDKLREVYCTRIWKQKNMTPARIAAAIKTVAREAGITYRDLSFVVVDQGGGSGKMVSEEFVERYGIEATGAEKTRKRTFVEFANGDFRSGRFKLVRTGSNGMNHLIDEYKKVAWDPDKPGREDKKFVNDCCDAALYAYREARHYLFDEDVDGEEPEELRPERGSVEEGNREADELEREYEQETRQREREMEDDLR